MVGSYKAQRAGGNEHHTAEDQDCRGAAQDRSWQGRNVQTQDRSWVFTGTQVQRALFTVSREDGHLQLYPRVQAMEEVTVPQEELSPYLLTRSSLGHSSPGLLLGREGSANSNESVTFRDWESMRGQLGRKAAGTRH